MGARKVILGRNCPQGPMVDDLHCSVLGNPISHVSISLKLFFNSFDLLRKRTLKNIVRLSKCYKYSFFHKSTFWRKLNIK